MKKLALAALALCSCVQYSDTPSMKSCITFRTIATKMGCTGPLSNESTVEYCENTVDRTKCQDIEECTGGNYTLFNKFVGSSDCAVKAYTKGCGSGVFVGDETNCP